MTLEPGGDYRSWAAVCRQLNADEDKARDFRARRYAFTHLLASHLIEHLPASGDDQVIYAVYLAGKHSKPVYLGASSEGRRRLWDLPIGESHHLSNTCPPETWARVQVLHWKRLLSETGHDLDELQKRVSEVFPEKSKSALKLIGMAIEFRFQQEIRPEINILTKRRQGGFKSVDFLGSKSLQAAIARRWIDGPIFSTLLTSWTAMQAEAENCRDTKWISPFGSVLFPDRVFDSV